MKSHILAKYVIRAAFLAMLGAVLGLWLLQLIFAYLNELEGLSDTYMVMDALKFILYRSPYFLVQFIPTGAAWCGGRLGTIGGQQRAGEYAGVGREQIPHHQLGDDPCQRVRGVVACGESIRTTHHQPKS